ncbi:MAG: ChaN family lipoprotein [Nitrospiraceae bacterium]|nr:ChaN family lipoprotein [Nitrospiraceae bacterium]
MHSVVIFAAMIVLAAFPARAGEPMNTQIPENQLIVTVDIAGSSLSGAATFPVREKAELRLETGDLSVTGVSLNGRTVSAATGGGQLVLVPQESGALTVNYTGRFKGGEAQGDRNFGVVSSTIDERGVSLTGLWYPRPGGLSRWKLTADLPAGYEAVSEGEIITRTQHDGKARFSFDFPHPVDALSLVATNRYEIHRERAGAVELEAYFFREDRGLAKTYLQAAKKYLELYENMLGAYPYRRFSVVENFLPTGYSLPTFTLLGQDVVRLPFITETSLGHEILHQWFGNSVFIDDREGNWAEGLTTYLADHWYEEQKGKGWEYRKQMLVNYGAYVHPGDDAPLREFRSRTDFASRAIGYGKAAMIFHLLRKTYGDDVFFAALKVFIAAHRFQEASWSDIRAAFESKTGKDLKAFFHYWVDEKGLPEITVQNTAVRRKADAFEVSFDVERRNTSLPLAVPVTISFLRGGTKTELVTIDKEKKTVRLAVNEEPASLAVDPDYDLARQLDPDEMPAVIARLIGEKKPVIVSAASHPERYAAVIDAFRAKGGEEANADKVAESEIRKSSLVVLGGDNPLIKRLFGTMDKQEGGFSVTIRKNPWNKSKVVGIIESTSAEETGAAFEKIFHYGKYSSLGFDKGRNISKKIADSDRGMFWELRSEPPVLDMRQLRRLSAVIEAGAEKRIVYVGEYHDRFSNHTVQLDVLQALHRKNPRIAVGMEMFQRPFQPTLDEYINGSIDEKEFLRRSEYFKRWVFDYNLYKPILDYCRSERIPVVALNLRKEIVEKVASGGMDSLSDEERKELPAETDFSDADYRSRLEQVFGQHKGSKDRRFDYFYQAQVLWDETMAESVAKYLAANPDRQMVVLAGVGHISYGSGIPQRAFRRNGLPYLTVLNDGDIEPGVADFVVLPETLDGLIAPRLLATFKEVEKRPVISDFVKGSPAGQAGLKAGDAVIALDGAPVATVEDIKLALFAKSKGDTLLVTVARKRFLFGEKVMTVEVKL